jgi:hypothetical protein
MKPTLPSIEGKVVLVLKSFMAHLTTLAPSPTVSVEWYAGMDRIWKKTAVY